MQGDRDGRRRRAVCTCGWEGPWRTDRNEALDDEIGHRDDRNHLPLWVDAPPDSPLGRVRRAQQPVLRDHEAGLDRLRAIRELRDWLDDEEAQAVIGARMARATWAELGEAWGTSRQGAFNRWSPTIKRYESAGLLEDPEAAPDSTTDLERHTPQGE